MNKMINIIVLVLFLLVFISPSNAGEKDVLKSLEKLKAFVEIEEHPTSKETYNKFCELLVDAKLEINLLKKEKNVNKCFQKFIMKSYQSYGSGKDKIKTYLDSEKTINRSQQNIDSLEKKRWAGSGAQMVSVSELITSYQELKLECLDRQVSILKELPIIWNNAASHLKKAYECLK